MPDHADFLQAICDNPADDTPRLVYADWLEENRQVERAEFIRVQVALADPVMGPCACLPSRWPGRKYECQGCVLRRRERAFLARHLEWLPFLEARHCGYDSAAVALHAWFEGTGGSRCAFVFRRGFVQEIRLDTAVFLKHAAALFAAAPIAEVRLSDKRPSPSPYRPRYAWFHEQVPSGDRRYQEYATLGDAGLLPDALFRRVLPGPGSFPLCKFYDDEREAVAALSAACVAFGRAAANLPPLPAEVPA